MYIKSFLYLILIFCVYGCTSRSEDLDEIYNKESETEKGIVDGLYAFSMFDQQTYNSVSVNHFRDNLLQYYPGYALAIKDSLVTDALLYSDVKEYWNIDTNERALLKFPDRRFATTEFATKVNSNDSLPYVTYMELADPKVVKIKLRDPQEDITRFGFLRLLEGDQTTTYMKDFYSNSGFFRDEIYSQLDAFDYYNLLDGFIADAERHGIDMSHVNREDSSLVLVDNAPHPAWVTGETSCDITLSKIHYHKGLWEADDIYDKKAWKLIIMWHEFGHDLLNFAHWAGGGNVMSSSLGPIGTPTSCDTSMYDLSMNSSDYCYDWERAIDDMFDEFKKYQDSGVWGEYQNNCG